MTEPRDVMAERFDRMPGLLRGYDVADAFITALEDAGFIIVAEAEIEHIASLYRMDPARGDE
jgi:hypothetical protein